MIPGLTDFKATELKEISKTYNIGGKNITFKSGKLALLAQGSVVIELDNNVLLTTAGITEKGKDGATFFPLMVDYQEKFYATGAIGGSRFNHRETRPSDRATLTSRMIDRPIRPMFPKGVTNEIQLISTILSADPETDFGVHGITGSSLALLLAGVNEFEGPVAGVQIVLDKENNYIIFPNIQEIKDSVLDLTIAGTNDSITMIESQGKEISDEIMITSLEYAHNIIKELVNAQNSFIEEYKKTYELPEIKLTLEQHDKDLIKQAEDSISDKDIDIIYNKGKVEFHNIIHKLEDKVLLEFSDKILELEESERKNAESDIKSAVYSKIKKEMRSRILRTGERLDGREPTEIRPILSSVGILPRVHGSGLFQRGMTQILSTVTLGGPDDSLIISDMYPETKQFYTHHYNFPPYSVGEVRFLRGAGRREIGHGRLGEKALLPVVPNKNDFAYAIRVVSEVLSCNGSSSMGSVCGSTLALMDAGVPISNPVSGVAMGMIYNSETGDYKILSDIQAQEDFLGDLDFKVTGTKAGITALQMDCKIQNLDIKLLAEALNQSKQARNKILETMLNAIPEYRKELSEYAPAIISFKIPEDKIREVIGKGGSVIQKINEDFKTEIGIEDDGTVVITANSQSEGKNAQEFILSLIKSVEVGDKYVGKVKKIITGVGAIVVFGNGKDGMIHISKISTKRIEKIEDFIKEGEDIDIEVIQVDKIKGRIGLKRIEK